MSSQERGHRHLSAEMRSFLEFREFRGQSFVGVSWTGCFVDQTELVLSREFRGREFLKVPAPSV
jgi:hypothetical protein